MKAGHSKLDGYGATLPAMSPSPRLPTVVSTPPPRLLRFYALIPSPFYPPPNRRKYLLRRIQERRAAPPLPPPSPWEKLKGPLPRPDPLLNRLAAAHHLFHPLPSLPSPQHPQRRPSLGYPSIYPPLVKLVKPFCWMLSSYLQWPCYTYLAKNTSHRKWHNSGLLHSESRGRPSLRRLYRATETARMDTRLARSMHQYDKPQPLPPSSQKEKGREGISEMS
jgi:hypothetical protein